MFVITPTVGPTSRASISISPGALMPISTAAARWPALSFRSVSGTPIWLFRFPSFLSTGPFCFRMPASISLVVVLPFEPVMPTTGIENFLRCSAGHLLEGIEGIFHGQDVFQAAEARKLFLERGAFDESAPGPLLDRIGNEIVAVEAVSLEGDEQFPFLDVPGVYGNPLYLHALHPSENFLEQFLYQLFICTSEYVQSQNSDCPNFARFRSTLSCIRDPIPHCSS